MVDYPHLVSAPITEAILDIRVSTSDYPTDENIEGFRRSIDDAYPRLEFLTKQNIVFKVGAGFEPVSDSRSRAGVKLFSSDARRVLQATPDGFTLSHMKPYSSWDQYSTEARDLWDRYIALFKPSMVNRVALRYVNQFAIPDATEHLVDYVRVFPGIPTEVTSQVLEYTVRTAIPIPEVGGTGILTFVIGQTSKESPHAPAVIDTDVFVQQPAQVNTDEVWSMLELLHSVKNRIFFECLTPKAWELFQ